MAPKSTPGSQLRAAMDRELAHVGTSLGHELEWSAQETAALVVAASAADRAAELEQVYRDELAGQARPTTVAKLASEIRGQQRTVLDALARVNLDPDRISDIRRRAVRSRWRNARVVDGA